jgi:YVTN family beta-propeller protein
MTTILTAAARIAAAAPLVFGFVSASLWAESTPSPALLVTNRGESMLVIVDPKDQHIVASIPVAQEPHEIAVSSDGKLALVSSFALPSNSMSLVDLQTQKEIHRYKFSYPARANSMVWVDGKFFFTAQDANLVGRYDPATNTEDVLIGVGQDASHVLTYNPKDRSIITANRDSNNVSFVVPSPYVNVSGAVVPNAGREKWTVTTVPGVHNNEAMDLSPDGKELWVGELRGGNVGILDVATKKLKDTFEVPDLKSDRLKFTPDGKRVLFSDITFGNLFVLDAATHKEIKRMKLGSSLEGIEITPDGSTAYVVAPRENSVAIIDLKTLEVTGHISVKSPLSAVWVP